MSYAAHCCSGAVLTRSSNKFRLPANSFSSTAMSKASIVMIRSPCEITPDTSCYLGIATVDLAKAHSVELKVNLTWLPLSGVQPPFRYHASWSDDGLARETAFSATRTSRDSAATRMTLSGTGKCRIMFGLRSLVASVIFFS